MSLPEDRPFDVLDDGVALRVRLTPKAGANRIAGLQADADGRTRLKVQVTAVPENGKANAALIRLLAKEWRLPRSAIEVRNGATDRNKLLHLAGDPAGLVSLLNRWMEQSHG